MSGRSTLNSATVAVALFLAAGVSSSRGGTRRHDVAESEYIALAAQPDYQAVGLVSCPSINASGVLVADNYVLTAAHVGQASGSMTFTLPSDDYLRAWKVIHPDWTGDIAAGNDLALIRLSTLVLDEQPAEFYTATDERRQTGVVVGFGRGGTGLTGASGPVGTKRAGENVWDKLGSYLGYSNDILLADFDNPDDPWPFSDNWFGRTQPLDKEYLVAEGDSGGGMFLSDGEQQKLAGIASFITWTPLDGVGDSDYGDAMGVVRISSHHDWLTGELSAAYTMTRAGTSGGFNVAESWQTTFDGQPVSAVPGAHDAVLFNAAGSHTVTWPAAELTNTRLRIGAGDVTLDLAGQTYTLTDASLSQPSLVVGELDQAEPTLSILDGTLSTQHAFLAPAADSQIDMNLAADALWDAAGSVFIGGTEIGAGGTATLTVAGHLSIAGELTIWPGGTLDLAGGVVEVGQVYINGGTLTGDGTIIGNVSFTGGVLSPGGSSGWVAPEDAYYPPAGVAHAPEPGTLVMLLSGALGMLAYAWRRRRAA